MICRKGTSGTRGWGEVSGGGSPPNNETTYTAKLNDNQMQTISEWQEGPLADQLNNALRSEDPNYKSLLEGKLKPDIDMLDSAMRPTAMPMRVTRIWGGDQDAFEGIEVGGEFRDKGYVATSKDPDFDFYGNGGWSTTINVPEGTMAVDMNQAHSNAGDNKYPSDDGRYEPKGQGFRDAMYGGFEDQKELLLARGTKFRVDGIDYENMRANLTVIK